MDENLANPANPQDMRANMSDAEYAVHVDKINADIQARHGVASRVCGECTACCTIMAIAELNKANYQPCPHNCGCCAIYANRPRNCRSSARHLGPRPDLRPAADFLALRRWQPAALGRKLHRTSFCHAAPWHRSPPFLEILAMNRSRWLVVLGALLVQPCLGAIYAWGVFVPRAQGQPLRADRHALGRCVRRRRHVAPRAGRRISRAQAATGRSPRVGPRCCQGRNRPFSLRRRSPAADVSDAVWARHHYGYSGTQTQAIFATGIMVFSMVMIFAGRWQDRVGPRRVAMTGGLVLAAGYALAGLAGPSFSVVWLAIGVIGGAGIGLAYVCPVAACVKWFPDLRGLITGLAVAGFGGGAFLFIKLAGTLGWLDCPRRRVGHLAGLCRDLSRWRSQSAHRVAQSTGRLAACRLVAARSCAAGGLPAAYEWTAKRGRAHSDLLAPLGGVRLRRWLRDDGDQLAQGFWSSRGRAVGSRSRRSPGPFGAVQRPGADQLGLGVAVAVGTPHAHPHLALQAIMVLALIEMGGQVWTLELAGLLGRISFRRQHVPLPLLTAHYFGTRHLERIMAWSSPATASAALSGRCWPGRSGTGRIPIIGPSCRPPAGCLFAMWLALAMRPPTPTVDRLAPYNRLRTFSRKHSSLGRSAADIPTPATRSCWSRCRRPARAPIDVGRNHVPRRPPRVVAVSAASYARA